MSKLEYMAALKRALAGLSPEATAKTLADYEQRFIDGMAAGRSDEDISRALDDPQKIAMTLRAGIHLSAFKQQKNSVNLLGWLFSVLGLAIFNLFMVVPAMLYSALLMAIFAAGMGCYVAGIAVTASALAGASELVLDGPLRHFVLSDAPDLGGNPPLQTRISISESGIDVSQEAAPGATDSSNQESAIRRAESVAGRSLHISTDLDSGSRTTQTVFGLGIVLAGIALFLLGMVVSKYTLLGIKRYFQMNLSVLRGE